MVRTQVLLLVRFLAGYLRYSSSLASSGSFAGDLRTDTPTKLPQYPPMYPSLRRPPKLLKAWSIRTKCTIQWGTIIPARLSWLRCIININTNCTINNHTSSVLDTDRARRLRIFIRLVLLA
jgi:hypothetical protein